MKKLMALALILALLFTLGGCKVTPTDAEFDGDVEQVDAQIPPELDYANNEDADGDYEDTGDEAEDYDVPRTIVPATDADQLSGAPHVDFAISNTQFSSQVDEIAIYSEEYVGKTISMAGYIYINEDFPLAPFAIVRDYQLPEHDHEDAAEVDHEDIFPVGIDCTYDGQIPAKGAWVRGVGTLVNYQYTDEEGEQGDYLKLELKYLQVIPDTEGGSRVVTE